jgi:hypothetical protein
MRKRTSPTTGLLAPKNRKFLIAGGIAAIIGTYLLAGDKIKGLFKRDTSDQDTPSIDQPTQMPAFEPAIITGTPAAPKMDGLDIDKKLRKGSKGDEVKRLQFVINYIAGLRKTTSYKTPGGYTVKFPIASDGDFGNNTQAGAFFIAPSFKNDGFITLDTARKRLAYIAGYYNRPFPSELVGTKNYNVYQDNYKTGKIDAQK